MIVSWQKKALEKRWNSLTQLKDYIITNKLEKILRFTGSQLETDKAYYGLYAGEISVTLKDKTKPRKIKTSPILATATAKASTPKTGKVVKKVVKKVIDKKKKK